MRETTILLIWIRGGGGGLVVGTGSGRVAVTEAHEGDDALADTGREAHGGWRLGQA